MAWKSDLFERLNNQVELEKLITKSTTTLIVWNSIIWQEEEMIIEFEMVVSIAMLGTLGVLGWDFVSRWMIQTPTTISDIDGNDFVIDSTIGNFKLNLVLLLQWSNCLRTRVR